MKTQRSCGPSHLMLLASVSLTGGPYSHPFHLARCRPRHTLPASLGACGCPSPCALYTLSNAYYAVDSLGTLTVTSGAEKLPKDRGQLDVSSRPSQA